MNRWKIALLLPLALLLGGCVTYPTYVYSDGYADESRYVGGGSYYRPAHSDYGDYYYRPASYGHASVSYGSGWWYAPDYTRHSAYYSIFWPIHRWYHDPYWYPGFYYGVTYFPRNYFSISLHHSFRPHRIHHWGHPRYSAYVHWYSPYRYSWIDSYYHWDRHAWRYQVRDNRRGYSRHGAGYASDLYRPRFGHARNQAERLAWGERAYTSSGRGDGIGTALSTRRTQPAFERNYGRAAGYGGDHGYAGRVANARGADYRSRTSAREPLPTQGFGVPATSPRSARTDGFRSERGADTQTPRTLAEDRFRGVGARGGSVEERSVPRYRESAVERRQAYGAGDSRPQARSEWRTAEPARSRSFEGGIVERARPAAQPQRSAPNVQRIESQPLREPARGAGYSRAEAGRAAMYAPEFRGAAPQRPMASERPQPAAPVVRGRFESAPAPAAPRAAEGRWGGARSESPPAAPPSRGSFDGSRGGVESRSAPASRGSSAPAPSGRSASRAREASRFED